jgi:putative two-component system response regulator
MDKILDNLTAANLAQKKILIVDDNQHIRSTLQRTLELENYAVLEARNGIEALTILDRHTPDLILSDINMPRMDGITFFKCVRDRQQLSHVPFIFLTANDSPQEIQKGRLLGVEDYLTKPINLDSLLEIIQSRLMRSMEIQLALIDQNYSEIIKMLASAIEGRDRYTHGHVERVTWYARRMAMALDWTKAELKYLEYGAWLHDIGKIVIPDSILNKTGPLTSEEWEIMKEHPKAGAQIVGSNINLQPAIPYILYHHERWDGTGYPEQLRGTEIPIEGRLLAIVDVYDALTTDRPYRPAFPHRKVVNMLKEGSGSQFDPDLVPVFIKVIEERLKRYREKKLVN